MAIYLSSVRTSRDIKGPFETHLNYIKCLERLLAGAVITVSQSGTNQKKEVEIKKFRKLADVTFRSIKKDIELAREDAAFASIAAPWFPVKCYYALYYLESVLCHLVDGSTEGFGKGGHAGIRKRIAALVSSKNIVLPTSLNRAIPLSEIETYHNISPGMNTRSTFWKEDLCIESLSKKLLEYKLADAKIVEKWNLHTEQGRQNKRNYISSKTLMLLDFFLWYRLKANYKDIDYIDFEKGVTEAEALEYLESYYKAFSHYYDALFKQINLLIPT